MFITPAYAQGLGGGDAFTSFLPIILIFVIFYFLLIRPQQKKMKNHRAMLGQVKRGDRVLSDEVTVEIADGVRVDILRGTITDVLTATTAGGSGNASAAKGGPTVVGPGANDGRSGGLLGGLFGGRK
jgi:preprotein translocase subunit YajC